MKKALFLDRDGILNEVVIRGTTVSSPRSIAEFKVIPNARAIVESVRNKGYYVVIVTNQPDVSRGLLRSEDLDAMHGSLRGAVPVDEIRFCLSADDNDPRRKPNPGMILESVKDNDLSVGNSFFLGDSEKDIQAGRRAGVKTVLLQTKYNVRLHGQADHNINSLEEILNLL